MAMFTLRNIAKKGKIFKGRVEEEICQIVKIYFAKNMIQQDM